MEFTYEWLHIMTGARGKRTIICTSLASFAEKLDNWNRLGAGKWQYWSTLPLWDKL